MNNIAHRLKNASYRGKNRRKRADLTPRPSAPGATIHLQLNALKNPHVGEVFKIKILQYYF